MSNEYIYINQIYKITQSKLSSGLNIFLILGFDFSFNLLQLLTHFHH